MSQQNGQVTQQESPLLLRGGIFMMIAVFFIVLMMFVNENTNDSIMWFLAIAVFLTSSIAAWFFLRIPNRSIPTPKLIGLGFSVMGIASSITFIVLSIL